MSSTKGRSQEGMFHVQYPARREFWSWIELGCLARALGFPSDLICHNVNEEVETEQEGMYLQQLNCMIELKLLNQALHRSFNMHTADWNLCVIQKAVRLLNHSVLSFEELHNIRVAYATYEAGDMKGLILDQRTLLRTLKMCGRVISPKKLMHRVKHMKSRLEEANRIQLYEFFELILWCDYMEQCQEAHQVGKADGKDKDLYSLVDFESLLSHQDQRRSRALDKRYLAEEWDFGREQLGSKHMFKGEVVYTDQRIKQSRTQKKNYRGLKRAVNQSQRRVYRAHAGSIRRRPISAPDLSMYSTPRDTPQARTNSAATVYESVQRQLYSAASRERSTASRMDLPDRPSLQEYVRAQTSSVVTSSDLDDVRLKMKMLKFDIITLETRCQVKKEKEMTFYIPDYQPAVSEDIAEGAEKVKQKRVDHWTPDIVDNLAYPPYQLPAYHAQTSDARFRGWKPAEHKGRQKILTGPTFDTSPHRLLLAKQRSVTPVPVASLHKDYVVRHTSRKEASEQQKARRPCTAPAASPRAKLVKRIGCRSAGHKSRSSDVEDVTIASRTTNDVSYGKPQDDDDEAKTEDSPRVESRVKSYPDPLGKYGQEHPRTSASKGNESQSAEKSGLQDGACALTKGQAAVGRHYSSLDPPRKIEDVGKEDKSLSMVSSNTAPSRRYSGSKTVDVGLIGTISLLESIQEHDTEEKLTDTLPSTSSTIPDQQVTDLTSTRRGQEDQGQSSTSINLGWTRRSQGFAGRERAVPNVNALQNGVSKGTEIVASAVPGADRVLRDTVVPPCSNNKLSKAGHAETGMQNSKQRFKSSGEQEVQSWDPSLRFKVDLPSKFDQSHASDLRKPRVNSTSSSVMSDESDHQEVPIRFTSVTVTIKNKNKHVTSTRDNNDVKDQADVMMANTPSPLGFKRSSPCITSTPRRKRTSSTINPPPNKPRGNVSPNLRKTNRAGFSTNFNPSMNAVNKPGSAVKERSKSVLRPQDSETDAENRLNWVQDQILAMNPACENKPREEENVKEAEPENDEPHDRDWHPEEESEQTGCQITTIKFLAETQDPREVAYQQYRKRRKASEGALKLKIYDLNADTTRRFTFNEATTRRLLQRVQDVISPELRSRIRTGDMGLKVN